MFIVNGKGELAGRRILAVWLSRPIMDKDVSVHRLTDFARSGRMTRILKLTQGPGRETLFDCLRLGYRSHEIQMTEFWAENQFEGAGKWGILLHIRIQGLHQASDDGSVWFFWGQRLNKNSVFGRWDIQGRTGLIAIGNQSFFQNPLIAAILSESSNLLSQTTTDHWTEQQLLGICRKNWDMPLAEDVCRVNDIRFGRISPIDRISPKTVFNDFVSNLANDSYRQRFVDLYIRALKAKVSGKANCRCVPHTSVDLPCEHDLALLAQPASE